LSLGVIFKYIQIKPEDSAADEAGPAGGKDSAETAEEKDLTGAGNEDLAGTAAAAVTRSSSEHNKR
jgi:hypothetical protein